MNVIISINPKEVKDKMLTGMIFEHHKIVRIVHQKKNLSSSILNIEVNNIFYDEKKHSKDFLIIALKKISIPISDENFSFFEAYSKKLQSDGTVVKDISIIPMEQEETISEKKLHSFLQQIFSKYSSNTI